MIRTHQGHWFDYVNIDGNTIDIEDIAHSLAMQCRFTGHSRWFYSVAEHCVLCSRHTYAYNDYVAKHALMHDAAEAYVSDLNSPLKHGTPIEGVFVPLENEIMERISQEFGLKYPAPEVVKDIDESMLKSELYYCLGYGEDTPTNGIMFLSPEDAKELFLERFSDLF